MAGSFFTDGEAYEQFMGRWSRAAGEQFIDECMNDRRQEDEVAAARSG